MTTLLLPYLHRSQSTWPLTENKQSKVLFTKSGTLMMLTNQAPSTRKRLRNSCKILLETSDPVTNSHKKPSMRSSRPSTRITQELSRKPRWLSSSSNSLVETEQPAGLTLKAQGRETRIGPEADIGQVHGWCWLHVSLREHPTSRLLLNMKF